MWSGSPDNETNEVAWHEHARAVAALPGVRSFNRKWIVYISLRLAANSQKIKKLSSMLNRALRYVAHVILHWSNGLGRWDLGNAVKRYFCCYCRFSCPEFGYVYLLKPIYACDDAALRTNIFYIFFFLWKFSPENHHVIGINMKTVVFHGSMFNTRNTIERNANEKSRTRRIDSRTPAEKLAHKHRD